MSLYRHLLTCSAVISVVVGAATAGNLREATQNKRGIGQDENEPRQTTLLERLTHNVDLWHDANLKGDSKKIRDCEKEIFEQIRADIASSQLRLERYEAGRSSAEYNQPNYTRADRRDDQASVHDDLQDFLSAKQRLQTKQQLASSLFRTRYFSNKYRLLGDYIEVLRDEQNDTRTELAEEANELFKDRVEGHRER